MEPKPSEVWATLSNRLAVIVEVPADTFPDTDIPNGERKPRLAMLWWDTIDRTLVVSEILIRLDRQVSIPLDQALQMMVRGEGENYKGE